jgi:outer membrane receptor protein involved in Fe transport
VGGDIGESYSWQLGASHLRQKTTSEGVPLFDYDDLSGLQNLFVGRQRIWGADLVVKWAPEGNPLYQNFRFVTEYYQRRLEGDFTFDTTGLNQTDAAKATQWGWYVQGVYQFHPYWRAGLRYDRLSSGTVDLGANAVNLPVPDFDPARWTVMADYNPSEFSRIRLELSEDRTRQASATGESVSDTIAFIQYVFSLGAHGAHQF